MPDLAILFWFYKEPQICENRLKILKKHNPDIKIYGLYGGPHKEEAVFKKKLASYLDDFYTSPSKDEHWKWIHGDLMILEWYESRGKNLEWESIVVVQWDMLIFDSVKNLFKDIKEGEIFLSALRDLTKELEREWWWTRENSDERKDFLEFFEYVKKEYGYERKPPLVCQFILEVIPRVFFEKYKTVKNKEVGMLEYKVPAYADIFDVSFYKKDFGVIWEALGEDVENGPLIASPRVKIKKEYIEKELEKSHGWRIFHPIQEKWDIK